MGEVVEHRPGRTITEADNVLFCSLTMNTQPLHLDEEWARSSSFGTRVVNGILTFALSVGMSVRDLTEGTLVANLGYYDLEHPKPVFHGDTVRARSTVVSKRRTSKPERGLVEISTEVLNQKEEIVCTYKRRALVVVKRPEASDE